MDNHSVNISPSTISCGVLELSRFDDDMDKVMYQLATYLYHPANSGTNKAAIVIWSRTTKKDGDPMMKWLNSHFKKSFLGMMSGISVGAENPRTGNEIYLAH